jgi:hypothetical protein
VWHLRHGRPLQLPAGLGRCGLQSVAAVVPAPATADAAAAATGCWAIWCHKGCLQLEHSGGNSESHWSRLSLPRSRAEEGGCSGGQPRQGVGGSLATVRREAAPPRAPSALSADASSIELICVLISAAPAGAMWPRASSCTLTDCFSSYERSGSTCRPQNRCNNCLLKSARDSAQHTSCLTGRAASIRSMCPGGRPPRGQQAPPPAGAPGR